MEKWKQQILAGNAFFNAHQNDRARAHYQAAKARAETLFAVWLDPHEAVASVVISYHNLADLYLEEGNTDRAEAELRQVHELICNAISDPGCSPERRDALLEGGNRTYVALLNYIKKHGSARNEPIPSHLSRPLASSRTKQPQPDRRDRQ